MGWRDQAVMDTQAWDLMHPLQRQHRRKHHITLEPHEVRPAVRYGPQGLVPSSQSRTCAILVAVLPCICVRKLKYDPGSYSRPRPFAAATSMPHVASWLRDPIVP